MTNPAPPPRNCCLLPQPMDDGEAKVMRLVHRVFCDRKADKSHQCLGTLSIDSAGVTLSCPLCGDARKVFE